MKLARYPFRAMGGPCELHLYGEDDAESSALARRAIEEVERLEGKYSRYRESSLASAINASAGKPGGIEVDEETAGSTPPSGLAVVTVEKRF